MFDKHKLYIAALNDIDIIGDIKPSEKERPLTVKPLAAMC